MLPKEYIDFTVEDLKDGENLGVSTNDLKTFSNGKTYVYKFANEIDSLVEWFISKKDNEYFLIPTPNSKKIKIASNVDKSYYIKLTFIVGDGKLWDNWHFK